MSQRAAAEVRKQAENSTLSAGGIMQRRCNRCARKKTPLRRSVKGSPPEIVQPAIHEELHSQERPLDTSTRALMEPPSGQDFSQIEVSRDSRSAIQPATVGDRQEQVSRSSGQSSPVPELKNGLRGHRQVLSLPPLFNVSDGQRTPALDGMVASLNPGAPLSSSDRQPLQQLSHSSLDRVRLHSDLKSRVTADLLGSQAFAYGNHIVLGSAANSSSSGQKWLLAHEVAHTLQQQPQSSAGMADSDRLSGNPERQADLFADAHSMQLSGRSYSQPTLSPVQKGLARRVIWKHIQDLPGDLLLILDVDDGDFVGGCVRAIVPHVGVKLIMKHPHTQIFNLHVGFLTNPAGEYCIFFYESVTRICEMKCFPSKEALEESWDEVVEWIKQMLRRLIEALAIMALILAAVVLIYLIAEAIAGALLVLA